MSREIVLYEDTDSIKPLTENGRLKMKQCLNSVYGIMVSNTLAEGKENKMIKGRDYILVHLEKEPRIIFNKHIISIGKEEGRACIQTVLCSYYPDESYADIVKQVL